jgi:hypothetical protein
MMIRSHPLTSRKTADESFMAHHAHDHSHRR